MTKSEGTSLDGLEREDGILLHLIHLVADHRGGSVDDRYVYGNAAKQVVRHAAIREACISDLLGAVDVHEAVPDPWRRSMAERRRLFDDVAHASQGVQAVNLRSGQQFGRMLAALIAELEPEISWDLDTAIPLLRANPSAFVRPLRSARFCRRHAPTRLLVEGPGVIERTPVLCRLATIVDHLRDYPRASREARHR